ncbi:hypothetical protein DVA67_034155 [Solirubrobacter sp. CPCC 204708]|nr:hypothetical protein [Solirubrobacter deserti]
MTCEPEGAMEAGGQQGLCMGRVLRRADAVWEEIANPAVSSANGPPAGA